MAIKSAQEEGVDRWGAIHDRCLKHLDHFQSNRMEEWANTLLKQQCVAHEKIDLITNKGLFHHQVITKKQYQNLITPICLRVQLNLAELYFRIL